MLRIIVGGVLGRMGAQIQSKARDMGCVVVAGVDRIKPEAPLPFPVYTLFSEIHEEADVIVDFSSASLLENLLDTAIKRQLPAVLAATGYSESDTARIEKASQIVPIFRSANMSIGIYVLQMLCAQAARMLPGFDIEIVERHHNQKKDAPSGTAKMLLDTVKRDGTEAVYGRSGNDALRKPSEIGVHAIRGGTLAGEHEVGFYGQQESIMLTHTAQDRGVFAVGALKAAAYIHKQQPGLYSMQDMMNIQGDNGRV